jgi:hypothetical protein
LPSSAASTPLPQVQPPEIEAALKLLAAPPAAIESVLSISP